MIRLFLILLFFYSCGTMNEMSLYEESLINNKLNDFYSQEVFETGGTDEVWGHEKEICNPFSYSSLDASLDYSFNSENNFSETVQDSIKFNLYIEQVEILDKKNSDNNSIHIQTDMDPSCEWIGMGIGWDSWQGKDISNIVETAAIEFMARVDHSTVSSIPIVFILEDYSENQCYATINFLGIDGGKISDKWTKVTLPLRSFSYQKNKIDLTNIKQLLLQCYDKVDIYIDDITIVPHQSNFKKLEDNNVVYDSILPINIFVDDIESSFGLDSKYCDNFNLEKSNNSSNKYIKIETNYNKCDWNIFGISWNKWLYTDLSYSIYDVYLTFDLRLYKETEMKIYFEDYNYKKMYIDSKNYIQNSKLNDWQKIRIPMKNFPIKDSKISLREIKNIGFEFGKINKLDIDNIILTN